MYISEEERRESARAHWQRVAPYVYKHQKRFFRKPWDWRIYWIRRINIETSARVKHNRV